MDRPNYIDLSSNEIRPKSSLSRIGLPSPRIQHFDGDIPPSLSPLDAFAAHSRRLAKELEETRLAGQRRMSRLPPQIVTKSLTQHQASRPAIFRSLSATSADEYPPIPQIDRELLKTNPLITQPNYRPVSSHPQLSNVSRLEEYNEHDLNYHSNTIEEEPEESTTSHYGALPYLQQTSQRLDYFGGPQTESPVHEEHAEVIDQHHLDRKEKDVNHPESQHGLAPPNAAFARRPYTESSEDDYASSGAGSFFSRTRKLSSSSGVSVPRSPTSAGVTHQRTSSNNSTTSLNGQKHLPAHLNFSRPRSSASLHAKIDSPPKPKPQPPPVLRQLSHTSNYEPRGVMSFDDSRSVMSDEFVANTPSSYTHSKFSLPRGRPADRHSALFSALSTPPFGWSEPLFPGTPPLSARTDAGFLETSAIQPLERPSFDARSVQSEKPASPFDIGPRSFSLADTLDKRPSSSHGQGSVSRFFGTVTNTDRPSTSHGATSFSAVKIPDLPPIPGSTVGSTIDGQSRSSRSNSTIRPATSRSEFTVQAMSADDRVDKAIELHQHGDLKESTYHLRIAAKQDHPTAMLLYALACRHGWGMRPNPKEGVAWLKKAVDTAMLEVADDEEEISSNARADFHEKKAHRAQFALSIYELGISHLNGWGVETDKALALRCFEIAGKWGDPDALAEAGFCYAEGIGCKKDLKKAAALYRAAAEKGISMVGNSWIYKDKYNDTSDKAKDKSQERSSRKSTVGEKEKVARNKSRTRSIFGRKKSVAAPT